MQVTNRKGTFELNVPTGWTVLDAMIKADVEWGFSCTRGSCARCRCLVTEGLSLLSEASDAEWDRLTEEELNEGYRLACQLKVSSNEGAIHVIHKPYF